MGFDTTYIGRFTITPPLNDHEVEWLTAFAEWHGGPHGTPFELPANPRAEWARALDAAGGSLVSTTLVDVPWGAYDWVPCSDGCCLVWRHREKSNDAIQALRFLVDHFLGPRALARQQTADPLDGFSFDHVIDGTVAAVRGDTGELFLIRAVGSTLRHQTVVAGT